MMFYIEEKQPNGKWKRGGFPFTSREDAKRIASELEEHGSGIAFRIVDGDKAERSVGD